jgi:hypothetical protein
LKNTHKSKKKSKNLNAIQVLFTFILVGMIFVTTWAALEKGVTKGFDYVVAERWGIATLGDAYCGFFTFIAWVFFKETSIWSKAGWAVSILLFGNIAMSLYVLNEVRKLPPGSEVRDLLLRQDK